MVILDISFSNGWGIFIVLAIIVIIAIFYSKFQELNKRKSEYDIKFNNQRIEFEKINTDLKLNVNKLALQQFEQFKTVELDRYKKRADEAGIDFGKLLLQRWIIDNEERIRKDAANRSVRVVMGKVTEHLIPFSAAFSQFNPKDARFIGSPIDLIVFDGIEDKKDQITVYFLEIKTGTSAMSPKQKKVMEAIKSKRVEWLRLNIKDFGDEVNPTL